MLVKSRSNLSPQKRGRGTSRLRSSDGKIAVQTYRNFVNLVMETARRSAACIKDLLSLQQGLMVGMQEFLGHDAALIDEPALSIVMECSRAFDAIATALDITALKSVEDAGQELLAEYDRIAKSTELLGEAVDEQDHYQSKVASLEKTVLTGSDKVSRNRDKLEQAKRNVGVKQQESDAELAQFSERRGVMVRATLIAYLRIYLHMLARIGGECTPGAHQCANELQLGAKVEIVALQKARALNGQVAIVSSVAPDGKRCEVTLPSGEKKSVRTEHLLPVEPPSPRMETEAPSEPPSEPFSPAPASSTDVPASADAFVEGACEETPENPRSPADETEKLEKPRAATEDAGSPEKPRTISEDTEKIEKPRAATDDINMGTLWPRSGTEDGVCRQKSEDRYPTENRYRWTSTSQEVFTDAPKIAFGHAGHNVELLRPRGGGAAGMSWAPVVAARLEGLLHGLTFTAAPLDTASPAGGVAGHHYYYFEILILEAATCGCTRTFSMGFAWPPASASDAPPAGWGGDEALGEGGEVSSDAVASTKTLQRSMSMGAEVIAGRSLPETIREYPYSISVGGDLARMYVGGTERGKVSGWRPLKDTSCGSRVGCLLEQARDQWHVHIFQDGSRRCTTSTTPPEWATGAPHGIVDVCGSVRRVQLSQDQLTPECTGMS